MEEKMETVQHVPRSRVSKVVD